jgi:hypothetical protein
VYGAPGDAALLDSYREAGIDRALLFLFPGSETDMLPPLDMYSALLDT